MIRVVTAETRSDHARLLDQMHRHRKAVFIDRLGWDLSVLSGGREIDAYDGAHAVYLLSVKDGQLLSSARLLPTTRPHLMSEHFAHLCPGGVPRGTMVWEASRFCVDPEITERLVRRRELGRIIAAILETGLAEGIAQVSFVAGSALLPLALGAGWNARPIGPTLEDGHDAITAALAEITAEGLAAVRTCHGLGSPVIAVPASRAAA